MLSENDFIRDIEKHYGKYANSNHLNLIRLYIEKTINTDKLYDVFWYIVWYYRDKRTPPIAGEIDFCIRQGLKDRRGNDPFKNSTFECLRAEKPKKNDRKYETAGMFTELNKNLKEKLKKDKHKITTEQEEKDKKLQETFDRLGAYL